ncbi:hypothetical protein [Streptomyces avermitilis]
MNQKPKVAIVHEDMHGQTRGGINIVFQNLAQRSSSSPSRRRTR